MIIEQRQCVGERNYELLLEDTKKTFLAFHSRFTRPSLESEYIIEETL